MSGNYNQSNNKDEPKVNNPTRTIRCGCAIQLLGVILFLALIRTTAGGAFFCIAVFIIIGWFVGSSAQSRYDQECAARRKYLQNIQAKEHSERITRLKPEYDKIARRAGKPNHTYPLELECYQGSPLGLEVGLAKHVVEGWIANGTLCLLTSWHSIAKVATKIPINQYNHLLEREVIVKKEIPLGDIFFFQRAGEISYNTFTVGGGDGGFSVGGAVIGQMIAGDVGAMIGSQEPAEPTTCTSTFDNRRVLLYYHEDGSPQYSTLTFTHDSYPVLLKMMPNKAYHPDTT